jgi:hypothetical protein
MALHGTLVDFISAMNAWMSDGWTATSAGGSAKMSQD